MPRSLLFTGHMIDKPDRLKPRFPASLEEAARDRIAQAIAPFSPGKAGSSEPVAGFASGARGGDILFHERCRAHGVDTTIILAFPPEVFVHTSVEIVPDDAWTKRFWHLWNTSEESQREVMNLPVSDDAYRACNARLLERALAYGDVHMIALWDGEEGDGPGGTADLIAQARAANVPDVFSPKDLRADR
jgi:hypothetical protein